MLAAMMGTPVHSYLLCLKVKVLSRETWLLDLRVLRLGRISTSLKSSFTSSSIRGMFVAVVVVEGYCLVLVARCVPWQKDEQGSVDVV
jgi:hypothetical protein